MSVNIGFYTLHTPWPWLRQTPGGAGRWGHLNFIINPQSCTPLDALVVYDQISAPIRTAVPVAQRFVMLSEPPGIKTYRLDFLKQFGNIISPFPIPGYTGQLIRSHAGLPWHFDVNYHSKTTTFSTLEAFDRLPCPDDRAPRLSVICSDKVISPEHQRRLLFLDRLKHALPGKILHYGHGFQSIDSKAEVILSSPFHLVLENNRVPGFWTEKLADAYLGWAFPVFSGGGGLATDFPEGAFVTVDLDAPEAAIAMIASLLADPGFYAAHRTVIAEARRRILWEHNLFALLGRLLPAHLSASPAQLKRHETVWPGRLCTRRRRIQAAVRSAFRPMRPAKAGA